MNVIRVQTTDITKKIQHFRCISLFFFIDKDKMFGIEIQQEFE